MAATASTRRKDARLGEREPERHGGRKTDAVREVLVHAARIQLASRARRLSSTTRRSASKDRGVATVRTKPRGPHDVVSLTR
jgi:hypothetical protein